MDSRFKLVRPLGAGGQGRVLLVEDRLRQGRAVALKRVAAGDGPEPLAFEFERLAGFRHPNIARAFDFGNDDEGAYLTYEYVDGPGIVEWGRSAGEEAIARAIGAVLRALALLHDRDLVHGDVSPGNLLVGPDGAPKLLDLGGACRPGQMPRATTPGFTAPEILTGRGALFSSDLYGLGVLMSLLLFQRHPFGRGDASDMVQRQLTGRPDLPEPGVSETAALCRDLIASDPAGRPGSAREVMERLGRATGLDLATAIEGLGAADLPEPRLVGRRSSLAPLVGILDRIDDPRGTRVARIEGPEGSGRSRLLAEVVRQAQLSGFAVAGGAGSAAMADRLIGSLLGLTEAGALSASSRRALGPWIGGVPAAGSEAWAEAVGFAACEALAAASARAPVLVAIDDFSRSDPLVRALALVLSRALDPGRPDRPRAILVLAGTPDASADRPIDLAGLSAALAPLDRGEIAELVSSMLPGVAVPSDLAETVYVASEGWPGAAADLVRQAVGPGGWRDLAARAGAEVAALGADARLAAAVLSMADGPVPSEMLAAAGLDRAVLGDLVRTGILLESSGPEAPAVRVARALGQAARAQVPAADLQVLAGRLAAALASGGQLLAAARLLDAAGDAVGAGRRYGELAARCRDRGDLAGAGEWWKEALDRLPGPQLPGPLVFSAIETWRALGMFQEAIRAVSRADLEKGEAIRLEAELALDQGSHARALDLANRGLGESPGDLRLKAVAAAAALQLGRNEQALGTVQEALGARGTENPQAAARLAVTGGLASLYLGRLDEASDFLARASRDYEALADLTGQLRVAANEGLLAMRRGDLVRAEALYDRAVALARELGDRPRERLHLMNRATATLLRGGIADAHRDYLAALDIAVLLGNPFAQAQVEVNLADLLSGVGDQESALKLAAEAIERAGLTGQERLAARGVLISGVALSRAGEPKRAEPKLLEARRRFAAFGDDVGKMAADLHLAELYLAFGNPGRALSLAEATADLALQRGRRGDRGRALAIGGRAIAENGRDLAEGLARIEEAEKLLVAEALPDEIWRLRYHKGALLRQAGRTEEARRAIAEARQGLEAVLASVPGEHKARFTAWGEGAALAAESPTAAEAEPTGRQTRDLKRLMEVNRELTREHDPKRLLPLIMQYAVELTGAERGMIVMPKDGRLEEVISHMISDAIDVRFSRSVAEKVLGEARPVLAIDAMGDERFRKFVSVHTMKLRSILAVPLQIRSRIVGVIYLDSRLKAGVFSEADRNLLEAFGAQAAIAFETARLISENARRCDELEDANREIRSLSEQLEKKLEHNEAKLRRVGALLQKTQQDEAARFKESGIVGRAPAMQQVMRMVDRIALTDVPVYLFGASGTGKELVAKAIHAASERSGNAFVPVNCGALPSKLLASELFGHTKGAFTGAVGDRPGLFRLADKGTLFLDEVTDMDPEMQAHLLRVLQDGTFRVLGGSEEISVDVRVISASNRDLDREVREGRFREDLFYRLNVVRIDVPPLAERREDIPLLVDFFARRHGALGRQVFSEEALDRIAGADWPGNVRELENEVLRALAMAAPDRPIAVFDLSPRLQGASGAAGWSEDAGLKERVDRFERSLIQGALDACRGNATQAARKLGISRAGLYKKLDKHRIPH